ncbi:MAG: hypothetical protein FWH15_04210 [Betaproteobacteria bacterium]|nr:hypothetical protein [Betaproteobacteria bacterium]
MINRIPNMLQLPPAYTTQKTDGYAPLTTLQGSALSKKDWLDTLEKSAELPQYNSMHSFSYNAANFDDVLKSWLQEAMTKAGIKPEDIDTIAVGLNASGQMTVSGLNADSDNQKLAQAMNKIVSERSPLSGGVLSADGVVVQTRLQSWTQRMFFMNSEYAMSAESEFERNNRATLMQMKFNAPRVTKELTEVDLDFSKLYRTEDGKIAGYPKELAWYFEADIAIPTPSTSKPSQITDKESHALAIRFFANQLLDAGYGNIPDIGDLTFTFQFTKNDFTRVDAFV